MKRKGIFVLEGIAAVLLLLLQPKGYQMLYEMYAVRQFTMTPLICYMAATVLLALVIVCLLCGGIEGLAGKQRHVLLAGIILVLIAFFVIGYGVYWNDPVYWIFWFVPLCLLFKDLQKFRS